MTAYFQIFEEITEQTLLDFDKFLSNVRNDDSVLEVMSYGGDVFAGIGVFQKIQEAQARGVKFTSKVYGLAASSAADIVLACDCVLMASTSLLMIHSAWGVSGDNDHVVGLANDAQLSVIRRRVPDYTKDDLKDDRWFTAGEAASIGLCDYIFDIDLNPVAAKIAAKYIATLNLGGVMEEIKKEETVEKDGEMEEKKEEIEKKDETPTVEDILDRISERLYDIEQRLSKLEGGEVNAACDDNRENARLRAIYGKICAVCGPCSAENAAAKKQEKKDDPKADLEKYKAKYPDIDKIIKRDLRAAD